MFLLLGGIGLAKLSSPTDMDAISRSTFRNQPFSRAIPL